MSPSALSRLIGRLEEELGTELVYRDTRKVELTEQGKNFLQFAEETLKRRDELHVNMSESPKTLKGTLRVYASVTACYSILPPLAQILREEHPELKLRIDTGDPADAVQALKQGGIDLALAALDETLSEDLECFSVKRTPLVFVARKEGPWASKERFSRQSLENIPLIIPHKGLARQRLDQWLKTSGRSMHISAEVSGNEAILALAHLDLGLGLVPQLVLENSPFAEGFVLHSMEEELGVYDIGFVFKTQRDHARKLRLALSRALALAYPGGSWR